MRIGVGLSIPELATRGGRAFSPLSLFTSGVQGAWYDPSDINSYMAGLGPELVTNGDFASATGWSTGGAWVISGGVASITASVTSLSQSTLAAVAGKTYSVTFTISSFTAGGVRIEFGGVNGTSRTAAGTYTQYFTATSTSFLVVSPVASSTLSIDDISVKEVTSIGNATMFQDSAGTTPVTAVEQPVGLMLDKSQGATLGSELVTNGDFSSATGWTLPAGCTVSGGVLNVSTVGSALVETTIAPSAGVRWFVCTWQLVTRTTGDVILRLYSGVSNVTVSGFSFQTSPGTFTAYVLTNADPNKAVIQIGGSGLTGTLDNVSVKAIPGNHAFQATTASRPVLRARYNQATYSEQVDNAAWNKGGIVTTGSWTNVLTAPDGTTTADLVRPTNVSGTHYAINTSSLAAAAGTYTCSLYIYAGGYTKFAFRESVSTGAYVSFNAATATVIDSAGAGSVSISSSSITAVSGLPGWYRAVVTYVYSAGVTPNLGFWVLPDSYTTGQPASTNWAGDGTSGIYIWGAQIVTGSSAGTYQRIAAATDYATAGFLPYLYFITDDSLATGSIDFSATDKMFLCAGLTKSSDSATAILAELSADTNSNNGAFYFAAPLGAAANYTVVSKGTLSTNAGYTNSAVAAPVTNVVAMVSAISTDSLALRVNGTQVATSAGDQGTGNYGNLPLYLGRRGNTSFPLNGNLYQMIVCGKTLSASELASTESFVATKTGVAI